MSTVMVITPIIIANWPAITAAVTAAVGSIGFAAVQQGDVSQDSPRFDDQPRGNRGRR